VVQNNDTDDDDIVTMRDRLMGWRSVLFNLRTSWMQRTASSALYKLEQQRYSLARQWYPKCGRDRRP